ncbi:hypothetical protein BHE90_012986 [Fusarium euwallaceae]|uniref:Heterokaryon incompatibility domain-containing protein n=1 Tax=Fusarium euwallaceae TaxID=1147111 RepID=A0A430LA30_9HYPO|nr:hypothetical protein BHE90_012986 [Fusarium euwallaceae]
MPPSFEYTTLTDPASEVRLLRLHDSPTEYGLDVFPLNESCPPFAAISYTWGDSRITEPILINGHTFLVRKAAWDLLKELPSLDMDCDPRPEFIWIDSICINQNNTTERNHQVRLMRKIYSSAKVVLVWLGRSTPKSDLAMDSLASLTHQLLGKSPKTKSQVISQARVLYGQNPTKIGYSYQGDPGALGMVLDAKTGDAIFSLFSRVYWRRIWIIQEVLLAREIRIVCGPRCMNWNKLNNFFGGMEFSMLQSGSQFHGSQRVSKIMNAPGYILVKEKAFLETNPQLKEQGAPISDLLLSFGGFQCRDRRDKVYGMLGLSSDIVDVNYAKSVQHIYNDVIRRIVREGQMDTISKAEYFGKRLAAALGIRMDDRQLIRTDSLFICPPRLLTWADERPFWENDPARVLPRPYFNHVTNILALSMTPSRPRPRASQRAILGTEDSSQGPQFPPPVGQISSQAVVAVATPTVQPTNSNSLTGYDEPLQDAYSTTAEYGDAFSFCVEDLELPTYVESVSHPQIAHAPEFLAADDQPRCKDDSELPTMYSRHVDYLSHEWTDEDIGPSWKAISSTKSLTNKDRLQNVVWRTWTKFKNNLSTISPEELNWLKESDVTWLYGPLYPASKPHPTDWQTDEKSILRRRRVFDSESSRRKKQVELKVRIHEEVEVIGHDGGLGYFEDEDDDDTTLSEAQDPYIWPDEERSSSSIILSRARS